MFGLFFGSGRGDPWIWRLQEVQHRMLRLLRDLRLRRVQDEAVRHAAIVTHREAVIRSHVITGALRASHRIYWRPSRKVARAVITPDPAAVRPGGGRPAVYGYYEHQRGGSHAFYRRAMTEGRQRIMRAAADGAVLAIGRSRK